MDAHLRPPGMTETTPLHAACVGDEDRLRRLVHELQVHQAELAQQNEELQQARAETAASLARYVDLYEQAPVGLVTIDRRGTVKEVNARALSLLQCGRDQLVGASILARLTPQTQGALWLAMGQPHGRSALDGVEFAVPLGGQAQRQIHADMHAGTGEEGQMLLALSDVTTRQRAQAELAHTREVLELSNHIARVGIWELDMQRQRLVWSTATCEIFGRPAGLQPTLDEANACFKAGTSRERLHEAVAAATEHGRSFDLELQITNAQGRDLWVRKIGIAEMADGRCRRLYGTLQDIDARMQADSIRLAQARAEAASRAKSAFLSRMSHELRTPLNAVLGFSYLLQKAPSVLGSARESAQVRHIHTAGQHLLQMIDDILDLSRIESGRMALAPRRFEIGPLVAECVNELQFLSQPRGIGIQVQHSAGPCRVLADPTRLRQVLSNLVGNAIKYNRDGGTVQVTIEADAAQVAIAVQDSGPGLTPAQVERLFEPFNRLGAEGTAIPGTGLGLVITRSLVQAMEGTLDVHSTPGQGSVFTVRLPRTQGEAASVQGLLGPAVQPDAGAAARPMRVLCIEDNPVNAELMRHTFAERPGLQFEVAVDGEAGLLAARHQRPDLVLLDMHLPRLDGMAVFRGLQSDPDLARIPCVAVSSSAMAADIDQALQAGFTAYVTKPVDIGQLLALVERIRAQPAAQSAAQSA